MRWDLVSKFKRRLSDLERAFPDSTQPTPGMSDILLLMDDAELKAAFHGLLLAIDATEDLPPCPHARRKNKYGQREPCDPCTFGQPGVTTANHRFQTRLKELQQEEIHDADNNP